MVYQKSKKGDAHQIEKRDKKILEILDQMLELNSFLTSYFLFAIQISTKWSKL
jgi:hypothetical protein